MIVAVWLDPLAISRPKHARQQTHGQTDSQIHDEFHARCCLLGENLDEVRERRARPNVKHVHGRLLNGQRVGSDDLGADTAALGGEFLGEGDAVSDGGLGRLLC